MKNFISYIVLSLSALVLSSCNKDDGHEVPMRHAVLVYMVAQNSLFNYCNNDIREMLRGKSQLEDDEGIILYLDRSSNPAIYKITNRTEGSILTDLTPVYTYPQESNSCSEAQLENFLSYVKTNYPVDVNSLVLWSHGSGWTPSSYSEDSQNFTKRRSFGIDNMGNSDTTSDAGNQMCISDLHTALQSFGKKFNYIMFDCCFMQSIEVDYELRDVANYIIASPAEIPGPGADYEAIMTSLFDETTCARTIPETYYNTYSDCTTYGSVISCVDCSKLDNLMSATAKLMPTYCDSLLEMDYDEVLDYFDYDYWSTKSTLHPDFYDMNAIFKSLLPEKEYTEWKTAFDQAVPYAYTTDFWISEYARPKQIPMNREQFGGVSMYVPLEKYSTDGYAEYNEFFVRGYTQSSWAKSLGLDDVEWIDYMADKY